MTEQRQMRKQGRRSGHAVIEVALLAPWIFFLFVGVLDFGFFAYAAIATQNAARAAALYTSSDKDTADKWQEVCRDVVLEELNALPNVRGLGAADCVNSPSAIDTTHPVAVTAQLVDNTSSPPSADGAMATRVGVTYQSLPMIPIPGLMMHQYRLTRVVEMRVRED